MNEPFLKTEYCQNCWDYIDISEWCDHFEIEIDLQIIAKCKLLGAKDPYDLSHWTDPFSPDSDGN